jgi:hypothetical protein
MMRYHFSAIVATICCIREGSANSLRTHKGETVNKKAEKEDGEAWNESLIT